MISGLNLQLHLVIVNRELTVSFINYLISGLYPKFIL